MESITFDTCLAQLTRKRDHGRYRRVTPMKAGVKDRHLRNVRQSLEDCFDTRKIVRLVQRSQRHELPELFQNLLCHHHRRCKTRASVNHAMTDTHNVGGCILRTKPRSEDCLLYT